MSFIKGLSVGLFLLGGTLITQYSDNKKEEKSLKLPPPKNNDYSHVKSWDYDKQEWNYYQPTSKVKYQSHNYSDEEIRILREKQSFQNGGSYIYTPGRHVPSREEEIKNYIDEHGDEIYEELHDKYGN